MTKVWMIRAAVAMAGTVVAGSLVGAQPAAAAAPHGCDWPRVCFYLYESNWNANAPTASYQDLGSWQTLGSRSRSAEYVYNSRDDDGARLRFEDGSERCLKPNSSFHLQPVYQAGAVTQIKIMDSASC
jgi:hypothetical protein